MVSLILCAVLVNLLAILFWIKKRQLNFWKDRGIPGPKPHWLYGNTKSFVSSKATHCLEIDEIYKKYRNNGFPVVGYFAGSTPYILVTDSAMVGDVMIRSFSHFYNNEVSDMMSYTSDPYISRNPFFQKNEDWKNQRKELVPGFTANRVKTFYPTVRNVSRVKFEKFLDEEIEKSQVVDMSEACFRYATELVADVIFGVNGDALEQGESQVLKMCRGFISNFGCVTRFFEWTGLCPLVKKFYSFGVLDGEQGQFFEGMVRQSVEQREKGGSRDDYLQFLSQLKGKKGVNYVNMTAHAMTFLLDGSDTVALAISHILKRLAENPWAQDKLRAELEEISGSRDEEISYDELNGLEYLDAVQNETLRMNPPIALVVKQCTKAFKFDNPDPSKAQLEIPVGTPVLVPVSAIHKDPAYYDDPNEFKPERFLDGQSKDFNDRNVFLPFGGGPRICLGNKFAIMALKSCIYEVVQKYRFFPHESEDIPVNPAHFFNYQQKKVFLKVQKIRK